MATLTRYFLDVRAVVNAADPYELLALGAPEDEYDSQVQLLVKWRQPVTTEAVLLVFGDMPAERAARLSAAIEGVRRHG